MAYNRFLSPVSMSRILSPLRNILNIQSQAGPDMISLGFGHPNPNSFPFESIQVTTKTGQQFRLEDQELRTALGYMDSAGMPQLTEWLSELQKQLHNPPYARHQANLNQTIVTPGCEDGLNKVVEMVCQPGDPVLVAEPAYPGLLSMLRPMGVRMLPVQYDKNGTKPQSLAEQLHQYKYAKRRPKLLIIQPNHCNPTGITTSLERKKEIYKLACEHDILILEDDPYYYLTFGNHSLPPSLLSMDTEGRVLRLESFSKTISAGFRMGLLSGPRPLIQRILMHTATSSVQANTFSQAVLLKLLKTYGHQGYLQHLKGVAAFYENRCNQMLQAAKDNLTGLAEWSRPSGSMFLWMKMHGIDDSEKMIMERGLEEKVMLTPGNYFMCDMTKPTQYLRASFASATPEQFQEAFRRLANMVNDTRDEQMPRRRRAISM